MKPFRSARVFAVDPHFTNLLRDGDGLDYLNEMLGRRQIDPEAQQGHGRSGFVSACPHEFQPAYRVEDFFLFALRVEFKSVPGAAVKQAAAKRIAEVEKAQGYRPGRKQCKEITEDVHDELLAKAPLVYRDTRAFIDVERGYLVVEGSSASRADEMIAMLARVLDDHEFPIASIRTKLSPAKAMTQWLIDDEAPANFTIDQGAEFKAATGATAKYKSISLNSDALADHIRNERACVRLAMTWADRVSFVLGEDLCIRSVAFLDVLKEKPNPDTAAEDLFDSEMLLFATEFCKMFREVIYSIDETADFLSDEDDAAAGL